MHILNGREIVVQESTDFSAEPILNLVNDFRLDIVHLLV